RAPYCSAHPGGSLGGIGVDGAGRLATRQRRLGAVARRVRDGRNLIQPHGSPPRHKGKRSEFMGGFHGSDNPYRLVVTGQLAAPAPSRDLEQAVDCKPTPALAIVSKTRS